MCCAQQMPCEAASDDPNRRSKRLSGGMPAGPSDFDRSVAGGSVLERVQHLVERVNELRDIVLRQ
jgi:hypothetical protein